MSNVFRRILDRTFEIQNNITIYILILFISTVHILGHHGHGQGHHRIPPFPVAPVDPHLLTGNCLVLY